MVIKQNTFLLHVALSFINAYALSGSFFLNRIWVKYVEINLL
ncbi:hypothetical protein SAMN05661012_02972 [Chitinophaga sancti]|uniref:Uncharacterized protein n=1 Tax=Chitinophaga sancti TaxID=1004 RepID=A0A1K1QQF9_9BACT|nr:hypothetical protein SAMN05661012_02972 [Chitinophaga sancti]